MFRPEVPLALSTWKRPVREAKFNLKNYTGWNANSYFINPTHLGQVLNCPSVIKCFWRQFLPTFLNNHFLCILKTSESYPQNFTVFLVKRVSFRFPGSLPTNSHLLEYSSIRISWQNIILFQASASSHLYLFDQREKKIRDHSFVHFYIVFCLYTTLNNQWNMLSNYLVFHNSEAILSKRAAFPFLILFFSIKYFLRILSKFDVYLAINNFC